MNRSEVVKLCRAVKALCPSQAVDQYTPDAWSLVLDRTDYADAEQAVKNLAGMPLEPGKSRYIEPGHIIGEVRRIRGKRLEAVAMPNPPAGLDGVAYIEWHRRTREQIAAGWVPTGCEIESGTTRTFVSWRDLAPELTSAREAPRRETTDDRAQIDDEDAERERIRQMAALERRIAGAES